MAEASLEGSTGLFVKAGMGTGTGDGDRDGRFYSLWSLRTKNGIKILMDFNPRWHARKFCNVLVELGEYFIIELHDLLHSLLCDCERGFLQTCHCARNTGRRNAVTLQQKECLQCLNGGRVTLTFAVQTTQKALQLVQFLVRFHFSFGLNSCEIIMFTSII